ncbi:MAG TPA: hypothetical protein VGM44_13610 [Polyangiaceae bacterium]
MKHRWLIVSLLPLLSACSKNADVEQFVKEQDGLVTEIIATKDADSAQKAFDAKKDDLKSKLAPIKTARGFQVSKENMTALTTSLTNGVTSVCGLQLKALSNPTQSAKYKSLCDEYTSTMTSN